ncbi:unnamed protein product [Chondrus crispus]|uniref:Uncharacterized protein n=1 Tax=Chondrus crispus TaxID=2769 RepID=R7Q1G6_CHOCR|nr:unnamed protein product [Chondrus crispus]CDF32442.1 unnamed protein product [Chondrus crispus]|eukprot:XP_005712107.1 unnamed protein product [Chondrus crispus]
MSLEIPISAGLANVFKFILINWGLLPVVEGTFAFLNRRWAAYAVMQGGSVYWKECRAGALYLHSKYFSRKSWFLVLLVSLVANALVFVMEYGVTFGEAHKSKLGQVLRSRDPNG